MSPRRRKIILTLAELGEPIQIKPLPTLPCEGCGKPVAVLVSFATEACCYDCWTDDGPPKKSA
jgi:hypothetical protein